MRNVLKIILSALLGLLISTSLAMAEEIKKEEKEETKLEEIVVTVTGKIVDEATVNMPAVVESLTAKGIERINAIDTSDVFKYMPGSYLRKLYPGSTNRPLVIRGNASFMTARTQVFTDGIQISDFLGAGNSNAPKWQMVFPQEIEKVDIIYGPFSAALSGNSISGTAMITTRFPQKREIEADATYFYQNFHEYKTDEDIQGYSAYGSYGDKLGRLSFMLSYDRLQTDIQPISYMAKKASDGGATVGNPVTGWVLDFDPQGNKRYILGSPGKQELINNTFKIKLAYDLTTESQIRFICAFWDSTQNADSPETYLRDSKGNPVYSGKVDIDGVSYNLSSSTFTYQKSEKQDISYGLTYSLDSSNGLKVSATVSFYENVKDLTLTSGTTPPQSENGGSGKVADNDSGWYTADLKASYYIKWTGLHTMGAGYHFDLYFTDSETWNASNWKSDTRTTLSLGSEGKTQTDALFIEDTWDISDQWAVYLGGRYEMWEGYDGAKSTDGSSGRVKTEIADKNKSSFSPKFSTTFKPTENWRLRYSLALAERYPTVGELYYGGINAQGVIQNANPDLKPEKALSKDFTITRTIGSDGETRLSFFQDDIQDAINSQTNTYTNVTNYQNVDEVRTRGIEFAVNKRKFLIEGLGIFTNLAWTESKILRNDNVPASVGKTFPRVPDWRIKCVLDYAPSDQWFVTLAGHYASRQFATLDNSDDKGGYGGIDDFLVFDTRFSYRFQKNLTATLGVDNITDESYHVSHPYPRRNYYANLNYTF
ncbi:MAG: TonB-dependent receptor [Nitrospira sp.]|nr:TonB-dependent receptor [Nitrospira sp.]